MVENKSIICHDADMRCVLNPTCGKGEPKLSGLGLMLPNPGDIGLAQSIVGKAGWQKHRLFNSQLFLCPKKTGWLAGPAMGAPMAVLTLEKLVALGAKRVIAIGPAGGISPLMQPGDIFIPDHALSEEGCSAHYPPPNPEQQSLAYCPCPTLLAFIKKSLDDNAIAWTSGASWTTDAPYRETFAKVEAFRQAGIKTVEMEYSALAAVARFRGISFAAVFIISDKVSCEHPWQPGFNSIAYKKSRKAIWDIFLQSG